MNAGKKTGSRWRWGVLVVLIALAAVFVIVWRDADPPKITVYSPDVQLRGREPLPDRWIPRNWAWAWRFKTWALGKRDSVVLDAKLVEANGEAVLRELPAPDYRTSDGAAIWVLNSNLMARAAPWVKAARTPNSIYFPRVQTGEGIQAQASSRGTVLVGKEFREVIYSVNTVPQRRGERTDLHTVIQRAERLLPGEPVPMGNPGVLSWRTNFCFAGRMVIPKHGGVFVVEEGRALLISATWK